MTTRRDFLKVTGGVVAGALAVWLLLRCLRVPTALDPRHDRRVLGGLAVASALLYFNFFSFFIFFSIYII